MVSVENFYWMLYENLLGPSGIDCWYYFPFGTTQQLSHINQFRPWHPKHQHHALFYFDQEPILKQYLGNTYETMSRAAHSTKICKLLANSEHSNIKKTLCRERSMLDWYFFYHGFAASDWYRDARYMPALNRPNKVFLSLNHLTNNRRSYRLALTARLINNHLLDFGNVSLHTDKTKCQIEIDSEESLLSEHSKWLIERNLICTSRSMPIILDSLDVSGCFSARFGREEYKMWQSALLHVVNETVFYDKKLHLTEKIFQPIVAMRPFLLVAAPGNLKYLCSYGFKTFDRWIDETYDTIEDTDQRLDAIAGEIERICKLSLNEQHDMLDDMYTILLHNKHHFFNEFKHKIVNELVDNFDACVRVWNNGRVDSERCISQRSDLESVKKTLIQ